MHAALAAVRFASERGAAARSTSLLRAGNGERAKRAAISIWNKVLNRRVTYTFRPILACAYGDTPAYKVQACLLHHAASKGCGRCAIVARKYTYEVDAGSEQSGDDEGERVALKATSYCAYRSSSDFHLMDKIPGTSTWRYRDGVVHRQLVRARVGAEAPQRHRRADPQYEIDPVVLSEVLVTDEASRARAKAAQQVDDELRAAYHADAAPDATTEGAPAPGAVGARDRSLRHVRSVKLRAASSAAAATGPLTGRPADMQIARGPWRTR